VTLERLDELAAVGITRVAVASAVTGARDPAAAAAAFIARLSQREQTVPIP
jgi:thiamine monophosphate synthase